jgi:hypothetical protein
MRAYYNAGVDSWLMLNPGMLTTIYQVVEYIEKAHERANDISKYYGRL